MNTRLILVFSFSTSLLSAQPLLAVPTALPALAAKLPCDGIAPPAPQELQFFVDEASTRILSNPNDSMAYVKRGAAYGDRADLNLQMGNASAALADFGEAIRLEPGDEHLYFERAKAQLQQKKYGAYLNDIWTGFSKKWSAPKKS